MIWLAVIFAGLAAYPYTVYPWGMLWRARRWGKECRREAFRGRAAVVMSSRKEGAGLEKKVRRLLELAAAGEPLSEIRAGLDGGTAEEARELEERVAEAARAAGCAVRVRGFPAVRGKAAVLNDLTADKGGIDAFVMMDVRQEVADGAVAGVLAALADPAVAVASGELRYTAGKGGAAKSSETYWGLEKRLRHAEGLVASAPGATGALYAIRASACGTLPEGTLDDDVLLPMKAVLAGGRCVFVPGACVFDAPEERYDREWRRKRRTLAGVWQTLKLEPKLVWPWSNPIWGIFWSHKVMRLLTPFWLAGVAAATAAGAWGEWRGGVGGWWWRGLLAAEVSVAAAGALCHAGGGKRLGRWAGLLGAAWGMNLVLLSAAWAAWTGRTKGAWKE